MRKLPAWLYNTLFFGSALLAGALAWMLLEALM